VIAGREALQFDRDTDHRRRIRLESTRYLIVGGMCFLIYFGLLRLLFSALQVPYPLAVAIAYALAVAVHFLGNRAFTFGGADAPIAAQLGRYGAMVILNYAFQVAVLYVLYDLCGLNFYIGAIGGILATLASGFLLMRTWVFARGSIERRGVVRADKPLSVGDE
jgi:putative flippase GtrA